MADTTEARRLADELAADVASLLREGLPQEALRADAAQSAIRTLADERDSLRAKLSASEASDIESMVMFRRVREERDSLRAQVEALRSHIECDGDALLRLVVDLRWALGDKGRRMQDDLVRHAGELRADAERFRALIDSAPGCLCFMGQDYRSADAFRAAIDAARSQEAAG